MMDTRWMLYTARWIFGPVSLNVESQLEEGLIRALVECRGARRPGTIEIRLPHPLGRRPTTVSGGAYASSESG